MALTCVIPFLRQPLHWDRRCVRIAPSENLNQLSVTLVRELTSYAHDATSRRRRLQGTELQTHVSLTRGLVPHLANAVFFGREHPEMGKVPVHKCRVALAAFDR